MRVLGDKAPRTTAAPPFYCLTKSAISYTRFIENAIIAVLFLNLETFFEFSYVNFENLVDRGSHDSYRSLISDYDLQVSPSPNTPIRNQSVIGGGSSTRKTSAIFEPLLRNMKNLNFVVPIAGALPLITPEGER